MVWPVNSECLSLILNSESEENHFSDLSDIINKTNTSIFSLEYNLNKAFMLKYNLGLAFRLHLSRLLPPTAVSALRHQTSFLSFLQEHSPNSHSPLLSPWIVPTTTFALNRSLYSSIIDVVSVFCGFSWFISYIQDFSSNISTIDIIKIIIQI